MGISDQIIKQIKNALDAGLDKGKIKKSADIIAESVKKRSRLGKSVEKDGDTLKPLKKLSDDYKRQRAGLKKRGKLSSNTTPAKTNLTKSGEMIDGIYAKATNGGFEIKVADKDKEKATYVSKDRPFMHLAQFEIKLLIEDIIARIRRAK